MPELNAYGFLSDPFPLVPEASVRHWAGREEIKRLLTDVVESVRVSDIGTSEFVILHGEYGAGKSHTLRFLTTEINETRAAEFRTRAVYLPTIRIDQKVTFLSLYRAMIQELSLDYVRSVATKVSNQVEAAAKHLEDTLPKDKLLELVKAHRLHSYFIESLPKEDQPMVRLLRAFAGGDQKAERFLMAAGPPPVDTGYTAAIDSDFAATKILGELFRVMTLPIGDAEPPCLGAYLFLDEFEAVMDMKPTESGPLLNSFRELVNQVPYGMCMAWSFTADTALIEAIIPQALIQRLSRPYIEIPQMLPEQAKDFLRKHFQAIRPPGFSNPNPFFPFQEATVELVLEQIVEMTPRNIFRKLRTVLERAIRRFDLPAGEEITPELADQILSAT